ncbi:hypothetical protein DNTS_008845 [Danionella cerebrum]|uniref:Fork-head domain-containing protein n=1 Tax=Danionella cerebrum TaxID=2873325 RepID=A0A553MR47_9TELE|nr:hypothetical protein DNTS_008845 [Danionella translucida]
MIESGITSRMSAIHDNPAQNHHTSTQDYRLLTTDPSQLKDELPGDLQSLSWLTSVDVPRLQQIGSGRPNFSSSSQNSILEHQTAQLSGMTVPGGSGSAIHLQSEMQHSPLAINTMPQFSPGFPCAASVYQTAPQQVLTFTQANQQDLQTKTFPKPIYSYSCLIAMALKNSKTGSLPVSEIYNFMKEHFPYFKTAPDGWKNSVRHNLSLNKCFEKVENKMSGSSRKGCLWALNPAKIDKMEEEMQKWKRKDLPAIRRSMANPVTTLPLAPQMQPQPVVTLSLQCLPMQQHLQLQLQNHSRLTPASPAPAQTPPLHSAPELSNSALPQLPAKQHTDFYMAHTDVNTEVDALDPSIMDFAWHGNLWEEMKDDSFNLESLGTLSNSPLRLSDCDLDTGNGTPVSTTGGLQYPELQVTGLYSSYTNVDAIAHPYINTQGGTKPIVLL